MILDSGSERPKIDYPVKWEYKVIGMDIDRMLKAIEEAASGLTYDVTPSNISKRGKYLSLNFTIEVSNEVVRDLIYEKLEKNSDIKIVL